MLFKKNQYQMKLKKLAIAVWFVGFCAFVLHAENPDEKLLDYAGSELNRSMKVLSKQDQPPYFLSYFITDITTQRIDGKFGDLTMNEDNRSRQLQIDLRVGSKKFDNTHIIRGGNFSFNSSMGAVALPLDENENAVRNTIWFATDKKFKEAIERYEKALTNKKVKVAEEDTSNDFSSEKPVEYLEKSTDISLDTTYWKENIKKLSSKFNGYGWIYDGTVSLNVQRQAKFFVSSEGSKLLWYETGCRLFVSAYTKADDGMTFPLYRSYFAFKPEDLPKPEKIASDIDSLITLLNKLRTAPMASTFTGPAILSGEAAGVFFHEIFGHRVEGHREKDPNSSQTFKTFVGKSILPDFMSVVFDPTRKVLEGKELAGYYKFDDEGITGQKVVSVDHGIFKNFLMSRSPIEGFPNSNGHGRRQAGYDAVSRQSNLIVETTKKVPETELFKMLKDEIKKQGKEYGLYFVEVSGGFTFTQRTIPNAFNVTPLVVYKVFPDDRPMELVRGVDLIGTPLTTFANIIAASDRVATFNGVCGAESGWVPVSASSPSLLVSTIEVQKKQKSQAKPPILPAPIVEEN